MLAIEDEPDVRELLQVLLSRNGYRIATAATAREGLRTFHQLRPDLVVLDVGLPDLDGWEVLARMRDMSDAPILLLTARSDEPDKVRGLGAGADDYMTKPFGPAELLARLYAMSRRGGRSKAHAAFVDGPLRVDLDRREVSIDGLAVNLTPTEYRLLTVLCRRPGQVVSSEDLLDEVWDDPGAVNSDRIKYTVLRLRRKLGWGSAEDSPLQSVRGFGYRYQPTI